MIKQEGARMICKFCQSNGINAEIICKKMKDGRLSWRNADGSSHFSAEDDGKGNVTFVHTPTIGTAEDIKFQEIDDRLGRIERQLGIMWGE